MPALDGVLEGILATVWSASLGLAAGAEKSALVVTDASADPRLAAAALRAAKQLGHRAYGLAHDPWSVVPMATFGTFPSAVFDAAAVEPYGLLNAAVEAADGVLLLTSELALLFNPSFRKSLLQSRVAFLPYMKADEAVRLLPATAADVDELAETTVAVAERVFAAKEVRLTSASGTNLSLRLGQYRGNCSAGSFAKAKGFGGIEALPAGQVAIVPDDGSIEGTLVVEGSLNFPRFERVQGRIELAIEASKVVKVTGGIHAVQLDRAIRAIADDGNPWHVTELGIGTNKRCRFLGVYGPTEDTHRHGTVSMALGADTHLGGRNSAKCHIDMALEETSVALDGRPLLSPERGFHLDAA